MAEHGIRQTVIVEGGRVLEAGQVARRLTRRSLACQADPLPVGDAGRDADRDGAVLRDRTRAVAGRARGGDGAGLGAGARMAR